VKPSLGAELRSEIRRYLSSRRGRRVDCSVPTAYFKEIVEVGYQRAPSELNAEPKAFLKDEPIDPFPSEVLNDLLPGLANPSIVSSLSKYAMSLDDA
jgi:hypothetical protein